MGEGGDLCLLRPPHFSFIRIVNETNKQTNKVDMAPLHGNGAPCHDCAICTAAFPAQSLAMLWERCTCTDIGCWSVSNGPLVSVTQVKAVIAFMFPETCRQDECLSNKPVMGTPLTTVYKTKNHYIMRTFPNLSRRQVYARRIHRQLSPAWWQKVLLKRR